MCGFLWCRLWKISDQTCCVDMLHRRTGLITFHFQIQNRIDLITNKRVKRMADSCWRSGWITISCNCNEMLSRGDVSLEAMKERNRLFNDTHTWVNGRKWKSAWIYDHVYSRLLTEIHLISVEYQIESFVFLEISWIVWGEILWRWSSLIGIGMGIENSAGKYYLITSE